MDKAPPSGCTRRKITPYLHDAARSSAERAPEAARAASLSVNPPHVRPTSGLRSPTAPNRQERRRDELATRASRAARRPGEESVVVQKGGVSARRHDAWSITRGGAPAALRRHRLGDRSGTTSPSDLTSARARPATSAAATRIRTARHHVAGAPRAKANASRGRRGARHDSRAVRVLGATESGSNSE